MSNPDDEAVEPDDEKIIVSIKGVSKLRWDRAKAAAYRNDETMGAWIDRAVDRLADAEAGGRLLLPGVDPVKPEVNPNLDILFEMMTRMGALARDTGQPPPKRTVSRLYALADDWARGMVGLPPKTVRHAPPPAFQGNVVTLPARQKRE